MNAMIERVAEKLYDYDASCADYRWSSWNFAAVNKQQKYRERVNVCIEAMREPTKEMLEMAKENADLGGYGFNDECFPGDPVDVWEKMIDEALK